LAKSKNIKKQQNKKQRKERYAKQQHGFYDPMGSYTGKPKNANEKPEQDADDL